MPHGTVKLFGMAKGFGFITRDEGGADVYVHVSELHKAGISSLVPGQMVIFDLEPDKRTGRLRAMNVRIAQQN